MFLIKNNPSLTKRDSRLEISRIIMVFFIIVWHIGTKLSPTFGYEHSMLFAVLKPLLNNAVSFFAFLMGYNMIYSEKRYFGSLFKRVVIYWLLSIVMIFIWAGIGIFSFSNKNSNIYVWSLILNGGDYWWFIYGTLLLYLLIPLINIGLKKINSWKYHLIIIIVMFILLFSRKDILFFFNLSYIASATSNVWGNYAQWTLWLFMMYFIGGFFRLYLNNIYLKRYTIIPVLIICVFICISVMDYTKTINTSATLGRQMFLEPNDLSTPFITCSLFYIIMCTRRFVSPFINALALPAIACYLFQYLFIDAMKYIMFQKHLLILDPNIVNYNSTGLVVYAIIVFCGTYLFSWIAVTYYSATNYFWIYISTRKSKRNIK